MITLLLILVYIYMMNTQNIIMKKLTKADLYFLNEIDAELFEDIQDNFVIKNGLETNFMYSEEHKEKLKELEIYMLK